jgi:hypothetical protein
LAQTGAWTDTDSELDIARRKLNAYVAYATGGQLLRDHPEFAGRPVVIQIDVATDLPEALAQFLATAQMHLAKIGLGFDVNRL